MQSHELSQQGQRNRCLCGCSCYHRHLPCRGRKRRAPGNPFRDDGQHGPCGGLNHSARPEGCGSRSCNPCRPGRGSPLLAQQAHSQTCVEEHKMQRSALRPEARQRGIPWKALLLSVTRAVIPQEFTAAIICSCDEAAPVAAILAVLLLGRPLDPGRDPGSYHFLGLGLGRSTALPYG